MSTTTISDRMSLTEMLSECMRLRDLCHPTAYISFEVQAKEHASKPCVVCVYELGVGGASSGQFFRGADFAGPLAEAEAWINNRITVRAAETVPRMALAIIEITDEHGSCSRRLLGLKGFSEAEIDATSEAACARASEMAGNAPFSVTV